ncbi:MAG TPA: imidazole glycerol phosphate synthase subunit HisH [Candidatus Eisenbacteria bacterium]|nr:imidazole glycerol phosphate synthase subunit HisH [Candidatus Eisenbacteria bacterium]
MIAIVDYGAGNLVSVKKALDWLGHASEITSDPDVISKSHKIVLPGVGHFSSTGVLGRSGAQQAIEERTRNGTPFLGICVGLQWMFEGSEEAPEIAGSGMFQGKCLRFPSTSKLPHVGWNHLTISETSRLFRGIAQSSLVYFTHSYFVPLAESTVACCEYGRSFSAAVEKENLFGVQFHPEKSGDVGLRLLTNFCGL